MTVRGGGRGSQIVHASPNHDARPAGAVIDMLVLHYTGMKTAADALKRLCDPAAEVSAHYLIDEDGTVYALVPESRRAWHAGLSYWRGRRGVNACSIGIELVNPGHEHGYRGFPEPQMAALIMLSQGIVSRHPIEGRNVVGHADVAPSRKLDPGELFDWQRLAREGLGVWPEPVPASPDAVPALLAAVGYDPSDGASLAAFQRHYRQSSFDGLADAETARLLAGYLRLCR